MAPSPLDKKTLRKELRRRRRAIHPKVHADRSTRAAAAIARLPAFKAGSRVAIYLPFDREADTAALVTAARRRGVRIFVPVICDLRHRRLRFHPLLGATRRGTYGIFVPERTRTWTEPRWLDLIVVPLVGVDAEGRRLGMGGGFYDRALAFRRPRSHWKGPRLIGFGFDCQVEHSVHADPWDVRLDGMATESGLKFFSSRGP